MLVQMNGSENPLITYAGIGRNRKALVIEDYLIVRKNHRILLEKLGFEVFEAADGDEAMQRLRKMGPEKFDLMIVDLVMPVMNGADFIHLCHKEFGDDMPQALVCSSVSDSQTIKKIMALGISGYVIKPVDYKVMAQKIGELFL